jgi:hypothetical protein
MAVVTRHSGKKNAPGVDSPIRASRTTKHTQPDIGCDVAVATRFRDFMYDNPRDSCAGIAWFIFLFFTALSRSIVFEALLESRHKDNAIKSRTVLIDHIPWSGKRKRIPTNIDPRRNKAERMNRHRVQDARVRSILSCRLLFLPTTNERILSSVAVYSPGFNHSGSASVPRIRIIDQMMVPLREGK